MLITTKTLTAGELIDTLLKVPSHTPVKITMNVVLPDDDKRTTLQSWGDVTDVHTTLHSVELEARA